MIVIIFDVPLWHILNLLAGTVFPLLVGLVTTRATNDGAKAALLALLSVGTNLATEVGAALERGTTYNLGLALLLGLATFLVAVGMHYGLWKPVGATDRVQASFRTADTIPGEVVPADRVPGPDHRAEGP